MASLDLTTLSVNIQRSRNSVGKSQVQLAADLGLARESFRRIEDGLVEPKPEVLRALAKALSVSVADLLAPVTHLTAVRFRAKKRLHTREDLLARTSRWFDNYLELEEILGISSGSNLGQFEPTMEPEALARAVRAAWLKQDSAIRDICGLLEDHGVKVYAPSVKSDALFGLSISDPRGCAIVVNTWDRISVERWIFTAAHELAHLLMHLQAYEVGQLDEVEREEREADRFASEFLMPQDLFESEWRGAAGLSFVDRVFKVKQIFHVSWKTVLYRLQQKTGDRSVWAQFNSAYKAQTGKSLSPLSEPHGTARNAFIDSSAPVSRVADEPEHLSHIAFVEDRLARLVRQAVQAGEISLSRGAEVLGVDLHEMRSRQASWAY
jgi:Zn-dependent peptidase ImmA (M78 family)/DNA-binding XRE family transcriptional regulator